jgi:ABC-type multidrug transport system ATPase subunit/ABC-type multidrug transport system permease subunit
MDVVLLDYLLRIFALIANLYPNLLLENVKDFLKTSFLKELGIEIGSESLKLFSEYYEEYSELQKLPEDQINLQVLLQTIQLIDKDIPRKQKFLILVRLMLFEKILLPNPLIKSKTQVDFSDILNLILENFQISTLEYLNCRGFIGDKLYKIPDKKKLLIVEDGKSIDLDILFMQRDKFQGQMLFLYVDSINTILFNYKGHDTLLLNNQVVFSNHIYFFNKGSSIKGQSIEPIYYNQVLRRFQAINEVYLQVKVDKLEFSFNNSNNGIHEIGFCLESEQLIGVIGRSGVGKSTLINLLIGNIKPKKGSITVNGFDLENDNTKLDGLIGYVPQDDLLIEELSVFTNLTLNARLCFDNLSNEILFEKVKNLLVDLDLFEVRHLKVGSPLNKFISGGQRKKLNIALELIREPWILYADEPTSGLSSSDSEEIMQLLTEQASKGRLVIVNIHQPSSDIFKLFDKIIVIDKEGYPVYFGNPLDAIPYFNNYNQRVSTTADFCNVCENINPESIFKILEEKKTNEFGEYIKERRISPQEWHRYFLKSTKSHLKKNETEHLLPTIQFNKPKPFKQFLIFGERNLLSKFANKQYVSLALLISPLLAILLASLCRYTNTYDNTSRYVFASNDNIPSFLFMSVIVALFVGLIISAEEIIRDRKILMRESYLKLSKLGYINSKVVFVFILSMIQTLLYVFFGNWILQIHGMLLPFWLILFTTSCFANLLGLLISSVFNSVVAIYIMVPLIIVPQILLSGVVVNYNKLNNIVASKEFVPFVGDLMASRWAYESLLVTQFTHNEYQENYFAIEKQESNDKFKLLFVLPELKKVIYEIKQLNANEIQAHQDDLEFLNHELKLLINSEYSGYFNHVSLKRLDFNKIEKAINQLNDILPGRLTKISHQKDSITKILATKFGGY